MHMTDYYEAYQVDLAWLNCVIAGSKEKLDALIAKLDSSLPETWSENATAKRISRVPNDPFSGSRCYSKTFPDCVVNLWLKRRSPLRLDTSTAEESPNVPNGQQLVAEAITEFQKKVLEPATEACGLKISTKHVGVGSVVSDDTADALWEFFDAANFQWPPKGAALKAWQKFVANTVKHHNAFDLDELKVWFVDKSWDESNAEKLVSQLVADAALLSEYDRIRQLA